MAEHRFQMPALPPNQQRFVQEYLVDLNATQAAIRAGYSPRTAKAQGSRLLTNVAVKQAIDAALAARAERVEIKADDVLRELLRIATTDISEAFTEEGRLKPLKDIPKEIRRAIASVEIDEWANPLGDGPLGRTSKLKFWDKPKALELLGKHLKLFTEKVEHTFSELTDEQLEARYQALIAKTKGGP